jgi:hypothetical protein
MEWSSVDTLDGGEDAVDVIVEEWRRERPDLDSSPKHVTGRIVRLASLFQQAYGDTFGPLGLNEGDYGVLAPLRRRAGAPHELTPTELAKHRMMTSGGMTAALDRLEKRLVSSLADQEQAQLRALLHKLLHAVDTD